MCNNVTVTPQGALATPAPATRTDAPSPAERPASNGCQMISFSDLTKR